MAFEIDRPFFDGSYRTIGMLWCPRCMAKREFVVPLDVQSEDMGDMAAKAECCECFYAFGYCEDEKAVHVPLDANGNPLGPRYHTVKRPVLSPKVLADARAERIRTYRRQLLDSGVKLERIPDNVKGNPTQR